MVSEIAGFNRGRPRSEFLPSERSKGPSKTGAFIPCYNQQSGAILQLLFLISGHHWFFQPAALGYINLLNRLESFPFCPRTGPYENPLSRRSAPTRTRCRKARTIRIGLDGSCRHGGRQFLS